MPPSPSHHASRSGWLKRSFRTFLDVVAPERCAACGVELTGDLSPCETSEHPVLFCAACGAPDKEHAAPRRPEHIDQVPLTTLGHFSGPLRQAITRFKYENHPELAAPLARALWNVCGLEQLSTNCLLVPVPLHPKRFADRGYNQAALLAAELAALGTLDFCPQALQRKSNTRQQARLNREERLANISGQIVPLHLAAGQQVLLIDDVFTTGSTASACFQAIRSADSVPAHLITLAYADTTINDQEEPRTQKTHFTADIA